MLVEESQIICPSLDSRNLSTSSNALRHLLCRDDLRRVSSCSGRRHSPSIQWLRRNDLGSSKRLPGCTCCPAYPDALRPAASFSPPALDDPASPSPPIDLVWSNSLPGCTCCVAYPDVRLPAPFFWPLALGDSAALPPPIDIVLCICMPDCACCVAYLDALLPEFFPWPLALENSASLPPPIDLVKYM